MLTAALAALLLAPSTPNQSEWYLAAYSEDQSVLYYANRQDVLKGRANSPRVDVWVQEYDFGDSRHHLTQWRFNCLRNEAVAQFTIEYAWSDGEVVANNDLTRFPVSERRLPFIPGSNIGVISKLVCSDNLPDDWDYSPSSAPQQRNRLPINHT